MSLTESLVIAQKRADVAESRVRELEEELDKWREGDVGWLKTVAHLENWIKMYPVSIFPDDPPASGGDSGPEFVRAIRAALKRLAERNAAAARVRKLEAAVKDLREVAFDGPSESKGSGCAESVKQWRDRIERETRPVEVPCHIDDDDDGPAAPDRDPNNRSPA